MSETASVTRWWWVRHAPVENPERISGQLDVTARTDDTASFQALAARLPQNAVWLATPLQRTRQTLDALISAGAVASDPTIEPDFSEQAFGVWSGRTWTDLWDSDDPRIRAFWDAPIDTAPPGGESFADVCMRTAKRIDALTETYPGSDIVCVAHAGSIRGAVAHALSITPERALALQIDNLSLTRIDFITDGLKLKRGGSWRVGGVNIPARIDSRETP